MYQKYFDRLVNLLYRYLRDAKSDLSIRSDDVRRIELTEHLHVSNISTSVVVLSMVVLCL